MQKLKDLVNLLWLNGSLPCLCLGADSMHTQDDGMLQAFPFLSFPPFYYRNWMQAQQLQVLSCPISFLSERAMQVKQGWFTLLSS
jgi:hypothetical protein